ncbi:ROK family protein [Terriglobus saanensis]|uniref:ROK family protein n=1 Tax=Terriglobus saanensis (strain ATCC BAA-1853 / DSM 23119 / SP1PR4) TaxID=401053 RepID=E8V0D4_TERSS|nr:ROK family protein [Terriglobus saanensis]ADV84417.1 ROK family protein [Terriglobus saanensis SP1PR4]
MTKNEMKNIGLTVSQRIVAGIVANNKITSELQCFPASEEEEDGLVELPRETLIKVMCDEIITLAKTVETVYSVGVALPGIIRNGIVEDSPNLPQMKGAKVEEELCTALKNQGISTTVKVVNDADAVAAGLAAVHGKLETVVRIWTLGTGIGFGRYPLTEGIWEGGHTVVSLDDKETYCGCGGRGHVEGIMGHRAMRLRFLDMEPEDVFAAAKKGDPRCVEFKKLWHKALAAATASSIHISGAGKFYLTGYNVRFVELPMLRDYIEQMVRMSPLQGFSIETRPEDAKNEVLGAAVLAQQSAK